MTEYQRSDKIDLERCLLCYDPACSGACPHTDPGRILRALRFDNEYEAERLLLEESPCTECGEPCKKACPAEVPVKRLLAGLYESRARSRDGREPDLSSEICGIPMENPFLLSSSAVAANYEMCARAFEMGWAGAVFKTIGMVECHETSPRFSAVKGAGGSFAGFKNVEQLSSQSLEENLDTFRRLKKNYPSKILAASIMGRGKEEWIELAKASEDAGVDLIECNFSCPHMEAKGMGMDVGQNPEAVFELTAAVREAVSLPVLAKMTPNLSDMRPAAIAAARAGADGIAAINTVRSLIHIPFDQEESLSIGGLSGAAVKPVALRFLADLNGAEELKGISISGMGGIITWRDALDFLLLGAESLQVTTAVMEYGYRIIEDLLSGLSGFMKRQGIGSIRELKGRAAGQVVPYEKLEKGKIIFPRFDGKRCAGCGRCYLSCRDGGHQAIRFDTEKRRPVFLAKKCVGCHLCILVCPEDAVRPGSVISGS